MELYAKIVNGFLRKQSGCCSVVGNPLCYHDSRWYSYQQISQTSRAARPTQLFILPGSYRIIPGLTPGHASIDHHWWYVRRLRTCNLGSVGCTRLTELMEPYSSGYIIQFLSINYFHKKFCHRQGYKLTSDIYLFFLKNF